MDAPDQWGMWAAPGSVTLRRERGGVVLCLAGEVDTAVIGDFEARHGRPVPVDAIDAGEVTFICAHGVTLMVDWTRVSAAAGHRALLRRSSRRVNRVLRLTGLEGELTRAASMRP